MIILLPLLRKLSVRSRTILGAVLIAAGVLALIVGFVVAAGLIVPAALSIIVGAVSLASARAARRRTAAAPNRSLGLN